MLDFREFYTKDKDLYNSFLTGGETNSESTFANMYAWRNVMNTKFAYDDDNCYFMYTKRNGKPACCFPRGRKPLEGIKRLKDFFGHLNLSLILESITENEVELIKNNFENITISEDEDLYDYVYLGEKLRALSGKKLHAKRNHINKFISSYPEYKYEDMEEKNIEQCIEYTKKWLIEKWGSCDNSDYVAELKSITEFLTHFRELNLSGGVLKVSSEVIAFTIGEKLNSNTCVVHVEKGDTHFDGVYPMINNLYIKNNWPDIEYVNREEDMGIEGIRKAKKSYYPDVMIKKYAVIFN